jgi:phosphoenolpyruvate carboxykinase (ATP)
MRNSRSTIAFPSIRGHIGLIFIRFPVLIRPTADELKDFVPDFTIYNAGGFPANRFTAGMTSTTSVEVNFRRKEMVILGTDYAGEMKKGIFSVMVSPPRILVSSPRVLLGLKCPSSTQHYLQPVKFGQLSLHSSANEGENGDVSLFFGLSGTGKTYVCPVSLYIPTLRLTEKPDRTLSADPHRKLIGDDEHVWADNGVFNIEGGCYAKCIGLNPEKEPEIFNAIRFGAILENVSFDPETREPDYSDDGITENTRCAYPIGL